MNVLFIYLFLTIIAFVGGKGSLPRTPKFVSLDWSPLPNCPSSHSQSPYPTFCPISFAGETTPTLPLAHFSCPPHTFSKQVTFWSPGPAPLTMRLKDCEE